MKSAHARSFILLLALSPGLASCQDSTTENAPVEGNLPTEEISDPATNEEMSAEVVEEVQTIEEPEIDGQESVDLQDVIVNEELSSEQMPELAAVEVEVIEAKATILAKNIKVNVDMDENDLIYINYAYAFLQMKDQTHFGRWGMNPVYSQGSYIFDTDIQSLRKSQQDYCEIRGDVITLTEAKKHSIEMKLVSLDSLSAIHHENILVFEGIQSNVESEKLQIRCTLFGEKQASLEGVQAILGNDHVKIDLAQSSSAEEKKTKEKK